MFDIGWTEMLVVAVVAIIFVGPKELPGMLRTFGQMLRKVRAMAGDFQRQFDDALREAELDTVRDDLNKVRQLNPVNKIKDHLNPIRDDFGLAKSADEKPSNDFDPATLFDESKAPDVPEPVKVDVEAALKREAERQAATADEAPAAKPKASPKAKAATRRKTPAKPAPAKAGAAKADAAKAGAPRPKTKTAGAKGAGSTAAKPASSAARSPTKKAVAGTRSKAKTKATPTEAEA